MRLTSENKGKITQRIVESAATAFRKDGYDGVNIDRIMAGAGLTRGAFYAHFTSKAEIFGAVLGAQHPLLRMLRQRAGATPKDLRAEMIGIFRDYLAPENLAEIFQGCTLAALTGEATRADETVRQAFEDAWQDILAEMARGQNAPPQAFIPALVLASGAVQTAQALNGGKARAQLLHQARRSVEAMICAPPQTPSKI